MKRRSVDPFWVHQIAEAPREAYFSAQQPPPGEEAWLPFPHGHPRRSQRSAVAPAQGPSTSVGLIWRVRDRRTFQELRRRGRRVRSGTVSVTMLAPSPLTGDEPPRVAFAVSRKVGTAVVRNRLRRQVRAYLGEVRSVDSARFPSGAWLFAIQPSAADASREEVLRDVDSCLDRLVGTPR
jgi:ribonuclease P protein component